MVVPVLLLLVSLMGVGVALALPGWSDLMLLAVPMALASLYLLLRAVLSRPRRADPVILDGSNVMHWRDGNPDIATVHAVLNLAHDLGMSPAVVFDANAGYLLFDKYVDDAAFAAILKLPPDRVLVVPRGAPADPTILAAARDLGARIISNDRFRDWKEDYPDVTMPGQIIRGGYRAGAVWLDSDRPGGPET